MQSYFCSIKVNRSNSLQLSHSKPSNTSNFNKSLPNRLYNLIHTFLRQCSLVSLLFIYFCSAHESKAQTKPLIPNISWKQSLELKSNNYVFHQTHQQGDTTLILASGKKNKYLITLVQSNGVYHINEETISKPTGQYVFWAGYHSNQYFEITEKQRTINEDEMYLRFPKKDSFVSLFSYRSDYLQRANFKFRTDHNNLYLAFKPPGRNKDSTTIYILTIDSSMHLKYDTLQLKYDLDLVDIEQFEAKDAHFFFIIRRYQNNNIEKRQFKRNYFYEEISFYPANKSSIRHDMQLETYLYYPHIRYFAKHHQTVGLYGKKIDNRAKGVYIYKHATHKHYHIPFDANILKKSRKPYYPFKSKQIPGLFPDMLLSNDSGATYYLEQYYLTAVSGSAGNATYNFHYNHIIALSLDDETKNPQFSILPKYQKTFNDYGQISSYKLLSLNNEHWLLINSHKKYLRQPYKTPNTNKLQFSYLVNVTNFKEIIPIPANQSISILTDLTTKKENKAYTVFGYKKGNLWIGELTY